MARRRERVTSSTNALVLLALVGLGALATVFSFREERQAAHIAEGRTAEVAASRIRGALSSTVASLRGSDALAIDGSVDEEEFAVLARGVTTESMFLALAFAEVVDGSERAAFEARTGLTITDTDGQGGFLPAPPRSRSLVVTMLSPLTSTNQGVLGVDLMSDPVRSAAAEVAERTGLPALSRRISTMTTAKPGVAVISAVHAPDGQTIGFLSSGLDLEVLVQRAGVDTGSLESFGLTMDGQVLLGTVAGSSRTFDLNGHRFAVHVGTDDSADLRVPLIVGVGTVVLLLAGLLVAERDRDQRRQIALAAGRSRAINRLGQALATATDVRTVVEEVLDRGAAIMDSACVAVALRSLDDADTLTVRIQCGGDRSSEDTRIDGEHAAARSTVTCTEVIVADAAASATTGVARSWVWTPLLVGGDLCIGAIGFGFDTPTTDRCVEERRLATDTLADLTCRSLERALTSMTVQAAADRLGELAQRLAGSHSSADVAWAVRTYAAPVLGAQSGDLVLGELTAPVEDPCAVHRVIDDVDDTPIARLVLRWQQPVVLGPAQASVLTTMVEMIGQTLERTALTEQEHQVIVQLQRDLLPLPPEIDGLDLAVHYRPAMSVVGLGGDFYDVVTVDDGRLYLVIGDVTGHGSEAVAAMANVTAVIKSLLRAGSSLESVCAEADALLAARRMYATAQIVEVAADRRSLRLANAGHPYPVLRRADGTTSLLTAGHCALLGLGSADRRPSAATYEIGLDDVVLLYTDGLIEQRGQSIDRGMAALVDAVRAHDGEASDLLQRVLDLADTVPDRTDDDVALLVVRIAEPAAHNDTTIRLATDPSAASAARRHVSRTLRDAGAADDVIADLALVASELVSNVVQHGTPANPWVRVDLSDPSRWTIEVGGGSRRLPGDLVDPARWAIAPARSRQGRGLGIVAAVADDIEVVQASDGTMIRCHRARS